MGGGSLLNWENECYREMEGLDGIVLVVWSYEVCFSWVGESELEMGWRVGVFIVGL